MSLEAAIAVHRFGLGARPGELDRASRGPKAWLLSQINTPADEPSPLAGGAFKTGGELVVEMLQYQRDRAPTAETAPAAIRSRCSSSSRRRNSRTNSPPVSPMASPRTARSPSAWSGSGATTSWSRRRTHARQLWSEPLSARRFVRTSMAISRTCCWRRRAIRRCCSTSTMRSPSVLTRAPDPSGEKV